MSRKHHFVPYAAVYAKALALPPPAAGVVVKLSSVEVMCAYCKIHGLRVKEWRGDLVVLERDHIAVNGDAEEKRTA